MNIHCLHSTTRNAFRGEFSTKFIPLMTSSFMVTSRCLHHGQLYLQSSSSECKPCYQDFISFTSSHLRLVVDGWFRFAHHTTSLMTSCLTAPWLRQCERIIYLHQVFGMILIENDKVFQIGSDPPRTIETVNEMRLVLFRLFHE